MSKNDDRILELKSQIELKKKELSKKKVKFSPETNCILELDSEKYNLNVCADEVLINLLIKLNMYLMSANNLGITPPNFSGYSIDLWMTDIKSKLVVSELRKEEVSLRAMESKLDKLLSDDKKTELEIDEIASLLK